VTLLSGVGTHGTNKHQALLAGVEYLENEPSSSEADLIGPASRRQVPSSYKITFPLVAIQAQDRYVGLCWEDHLRFSALLDSPDRTFGTAGHLLGVLWPQADGDNRAEGSLLPFSPETLKAGVLLKSRARILVGSGATVIPAVQHYLRLKPLPPLPDTRLDFKGYTQLAVQGWLKSKIREGGLYRHAYWAHFKPQPAGDAAVYESWLAQNITSPALAGELSNAASAALGNVKPLAYYHSGVGHVRVPVAPLVFNHAREGIAAARSVAQHNLRQLGPDGIVIYHPQKDKPDFGKTYWTNHANGLTALAVFQALEGAAFSGDADLRRQALERLRGLARYRNSVPRGAQTWEIPLHTPDILACAHLVHAYALGFELTGDQEFLAQAKYWAWTGVPFIYLVNPTGQPVGPYSTIAVLGATAWKAPVWLGQPVQWCGMVYADALFRLSRLDTAGPWHQLAAGITRAGLQHTWKADDPERVGLLPDFYLLQDQRSDGPAINPATVGIGVPQVYGKTPIYEFRGAPQAGVFAHAPGRVELKEQSPKRAVFAIEGWPAGKYSILLQGIKPGSQVKANQTPLKLEPPQDYDAASGSLVLQVSGKTQVEVVVP
jgi:hypothetical protein